MPRFMIEDWADDSIGQGFVLYYLGEFVGCSGSIRLLRKWARECWQQQQD